MFLKNNFYYCYKKIKKYQEARFLNNFLKRNIFTFSKVLIKQYLEKINITTFES